MSGQSIIGGRLTLQTFPEFRMNGKFNAAFAWRNEIPYLKREIKAIRAEAARQIARINERLAERMAHAKAEANRSWTDYEADIRKQRQPDDYWPAGVIENDDSMKVV